MSFLVATDLAFGYGGRVVLDGVSLEVNRGELAVLVGPNGSGKSTLLRLLTGVLIPTRGEVRVDGAVVKNLKPAEIARQVGVVRQDTSLDFEFTGFEVAMMGRAPHLGVFGRETAHDRAVVMESLAMTDATHLADRSIQEVSGGERQRVMVARALAQQPAGLLMDEPTTHLDINHQAELLQLVRRLTAEREMATLVVLHDLNLAAAYSDRILVLHEGRIAAEGPPGEVLTSKNIAKFFEADTLVIPHPETGRPVVLLR